MGKSSLVVKPVFRRLSLKPTGGGGRVRGRPFLSLLVFFSAIGFCVAIPPAGAEDPGCVDQAGVPLLAGTPCGSQIENTCNAPDTCDGEGNCNPNIAPKGTVCRPKVNECDLAEVCGGCNGCLQCPPDEFKREGQNCEDRDQISCTQGSCTDDHTCVTHPVDTRCDDQNSCTEDQCVVASGGCVNTLVATEVDATATGGSRAYGFSGFSSAGPERVEFPPTPDTDVPTDPEQIAKIDGAPLSVVHGLKVEESSTSGVDGSGKPTIENSATATTLDTKLLENPPMSGMFVIQATALRAVANCEANAQGARSDSDGSRIEGLTIGDMNFDLITDPMELTLDLPIGKAEVKLLEKKGSGAKAGEVQPVDGEFASDLEVNAIHLTVKDPDGNTVLEVVAAHADCEVTFSGVCEEFPFVSGRGLAVGVKLDEVDPDSESLLLDMKVGESVLPSTGGFDDATLKHVGPIGNETTTLVEASTGFTRTEGSVDQANNTASSSTHAELADADVIDTGEAPSDPFMHADVLQADCSSSASSNGSASSGNAILVGLTIGGENVCGDLMLEPLCSPAPNTEIPGPSPNTLIRLNEQRCDDGTLPSGTPPQCTGANSSGITINAVHVFLLGDGNPGELPINGDIIISSAHCDTGTP